MNDGIFGAFIAVHWSLPHSRCAADITYMLFTRVRTLCHALGHAVRRERTCHSQQFTSQQNALLE